MFSFLQRLSEAQNHFIGEVLFHVKFFISTKYTKLIDKQITKKTVQLEGAICENILFELAMHLQSV